jgi:hypothetical protein
MTRVEKLLSISSEALANRPAAITHFFSEYALATNLFGMLNGKNGFYTFEHALHVFPFGSDVTGAMTLEDWNSITLWRSAYGHLADGLLFFAEDSFGDQFCLSNTRSGVFRFASETAETVHLAESIEEWAELILSNYEFETGWPLAHEWQTRNGILEFGQRLQPKIPFVYGGEYKIENLWAGDAVKGMLFKAEIALKIKDLPDGAQIQLKIKDDRR